MEFMNLSDKPLRFGGSKEGLLKMIVLPDYSPGREGLPVGVVGVYDRMSHEVQADYLGPDIGCGMTLAKFERPLEGLEYLTHNAASRLKSSSSELRSLGGGNHFITFYEAVKIAEDSEVGLQAEDNLVLVHSGSGELGRQVYAHGVSGGRFMGVYDRLIGFGLQNRKNILDLIQNMAKNRMEIVSNHPHNTVELDDEQVTYRKGAIKLLPGEITVIPSSMGGDALIVRAKPQIVELENSMCHGTGRKISRSSAKSRDFDFTDLRKRVFIPSFIRDKNIQSEHPDCYRKIEEVYPAIRQYLDLIGVLSPRSFLCS
ncbi:MAG: RtcB family protein [Nanoarchaeota archaeon]|nr:RtcB family protein [Nanoarchaeota archaeon]